MSSRSDALQRRVRSGHSTGHTAVPGGQHSSSTAAGGLKTWHLWMLFGLGWPSILLYGLSTISAFSARAQGLLLTFGWLFCGCWWANAASGILTDNHSKKQAAVFTASYIMAGIGSLIGAVLSASYALHHWNWLYIGALVVAAGAVVFVRSLDEGSNSRAAMPQGEGAAAGAPAASAGTAEVGDLIDLRD